MKIQTKLLGEIDIDKSEIISFPDGIPAFEEEKQFLIIPLEEDSPFYYLQALSSPELCLLLVDPFKFFIDYHVELKDDQIQKLEASEKEDSIMAFAIVTVPEDFKKATANLLAPVIINVQKKKGLQFIPEKSDYKTRHYLFAQEKDQPKQEAR